MLPPALSLLKDRLEEKGIQRSVYQDRLLDELRFLDQNRDIRTLIERKEFRELPMIVSGPGRCPCCGS